MTSKPPAAGIRRPPSPARKAAARSTRSPGPAVSRSASRSRDRAATTVTKITIKVDVAPMWRDTLRFAAAMLIVFVCIRSGQLASGVVAGGSVVAIGGPLDDLLSRLTKR